MKNNDLRVAMDNDRTTVGDSFRGRASVRSLDPGAATDQDIEQLRGLKVALRFFTEGRGDTDAHTVSAIELPAFDYRTADQAFEIVVPPHSPISYDGRLIRVRWEVEVSLDIKRRTDPVVVVPVLVIPIDGWEHYDQPHPLTH